MAKDTDLAIQHARSISEKVTKRITARSATSGRFVTSSSARRHPNEAVTEQGRRNGKTQG